MRTVLALLLTLASCCLMPAPDRSVAETVALRVDGLTVEPANPLAGDVVTVRFEVSDVHGTPVSGLYARASVLPAPGRLDTTTSIADVRSALEVAPGKYELRVPFNEPGRWRLAVEATDGIVSTGSEMTVEVAPRLVPAPPSEMPLMLRGSSWVTALRFDPSTGSLVRFLGETVVDAGETRFLVRRSSSPVGVVSRLYGGLWQLSLVLTDIRSGAELHVDLPPVRASLQPGSSATPATTFALAGAPDRSVFLIYRAARLGESWSAEILAIDSRSGEMLVERNLPGTLRGSQLLPRIAAIPGGELVVLERALSLDASGEARLSLLDTETLELRSVRRWRFDTATGGELDCLANPTIDGGPLGTLRPSWFAWCRDATTVWIGLWDLSTGRTIARVPADPTTTVLLPAPDGRWLYLVDTRVRRVVALEAETGQLREPAATDPASTSDPPWQRLSRLLLGDARAASLPSLRATLSSDGRLLYAVFPTTGELGDGIWVYETATLKPVERLLPGWLVRGVVLAPDGSVVAIADAAGGDRLVVLRDGEPWRMVSVPERISEVLQD